YGAWGQGLGVAGPSTLWRFHDHQSHPSRCRIRCAPRHRGAGSSLEPRARGASGSQELLARGRDVGRRTWIRHTRAGSTARPDGLRRRAAVALDCHRTPRGTGPAADGVGFLADAAQRSEEHTSELQSRENLVCRLLLEKKKKAIIKKTSDRE